MRLIKSYQETLCLEIQRVLQVESEHHYHALRNRLHVRKMKNENKERHNLDRTKPIKVSLPKLFKQGLSVSH